MNNGTNKSVVYSSQPQNLRPGNNYLTDLSLAEGEYCVFTAEMPAGAIVPLHSHADRETFYILSGEMEFYDGSSWHILKEGECMDVLNSTKHAWRNASASKASMLIVSTVRMGRFLQMVSKQAAGNPDGETATVQKEHFFNLIREYGYWLGSPEDNEAIGLSSNWHEAAKH